MNAIIYARFSPRPNGEECDSIDKQLERCRAYCVAQQYLDAAEYNDANASGGRADNRPGLQQAIEHVCRVKGVLVCYDLSRLARNTSDAIEIAERLQAAGANLAFLDMKIDTSSPTGRCFFTILAAFAQLYREQISERTSVAMLKHQAAGVRMSYRLPFGFKLQRKGSTLMEPDCGEQAQVVVILELHRQGEGLREIARAMKAQGYKCRGGDWHHQTIKNIIQRYGEKPCEEASNKA